MNGWRQGGHPTVQYELILDNLLQMMTQFFFLLRFLYNLGGESSSERFQVNVWKSTRKQLSMS
jgi:hypothetical protein